MPNRSKKIVFWGTVLTTVSFFIGLFHSLLPAFAVAILTAVLSVPIILIAAVMTVAFSLFATIIFSMILLAANPFGFLFCMAALLLIRYRMRRAKR